MFASSFEVKWWVHFFIWRPMFASFYYKYTKSILLTEESPVECKFSRKKIAFANERNI